jgi:hypothetical protein
MIGGFSVEAALGYSVGQFMPDEKPADIQPAARGGA